MKKKEETLAVPKNGTASFSQWRQGNLSNGETREGVKRMDGTSEVCRESHYIEDS